MAAPARSRHWQWLLIVPTVAPLLTPLANRIEPALMGVPFFFWYQIGCAVLAIAVISIVHLATREDGHE
jgi:dolichyl-phosphate-mannose--protein O-mannosyl transferase